MSGPAPGEYAICCRPIYDAPNGQLFRFVSPPLGPDGYQCIWRTDVYTYDSGICMAGAHVGVITRERGGVVNIEMRAG